MYKRVMAGLSYRALYFLSAYFVFCYIPAFSETAIRSTAALKIARNIWHNNFVDALNASEQILKAEEDNPVGYFLLGTIYQTISEEYRTDRFQDTISNYLDRAIDLAEKRQVREPYNPDWKFIAGASYGYRALHRAFHGNWWGAFRDGFRCNSALNKTIETDSSFYDAYLGLGAYHYYRTVKAKDFLWLPFISDQRDQGIAEIRLAAQRGYLASFNARESLLRIYFLEERYDELFALADSLARIVPRDPYALLYYAEGLISVGRLEEAETKIRQLRTAWKSSPYFDPFGVFEAELLTAKIALARKDKETAGKIVEKILTEKAMRRANAYFAETLEKADALAAALR